MFMVASCLFLPLCVYDETGGQKSTGAKDFFHPPKERLGNAAAGALVSDSGERTNHSRRLSSTMLHAILPRGDSCASCSPSPSFVSPPSQRSRLPSLPPLPDLSPVAGPLPLMFTAPPSTSTSNSISRATS